MDDKPDPKGAFVLGLFGSLVITGMLMMLWKMPESPRDESDPVWQAVKVMFATFYVTAIACMFTLTFFAACKVDSEKDQRE